MPLDAVKRAITSTRYLHPEKFFRVVAYRPVTGRYAKDLRVYAAEPGADAPQRTKPAQREKARQASRTDQRTCTRTKSERESYKPVAWLGNPRNTGAHVCSRQCLSARLAGFFFLNTHDFQEIPAPPTSRPKLLGADKATARQRGAGQPGPSPKPPGTVPPARIYLMHAPVYRPAPEPPRRPGADDHYRFRSLTATADAR